MHRILTHTNGVYIVYANRSIVLACIESLPKSDGRFLQKGTWNQQRLVSKIPKQAISFKTYFQYKTRDLHLSLGGKENTASASTVRIGEQCSKGEVDIRDSMLSHITKHLKQTQVMVVAGVLACIFLLVPAAVAVDALKTWGCLLKECSLELAKCIANPSSILCSQSLVFLHIKCGDLFENRVVDEFNECAVSRKICVPQKSDVSEFPVPDPSALVKKFNIEDFTGKWYIIQIPDSIVPEIERAAKSVGRDFNTFIKTDNTCGPEPPLVERIERTVEEGERTIVREVEEIEGEIVNEVEKVERTERTLLERLFEGFKELKQDEENLLRGLSEEEMAILNDLKMEANEVEKLFGQALPPRKLR
ncbi:hypothetical protein MKW92_007934 [Papaver armeniacum]|nr:hypothetical protein MKW92_007934 [Papaver armeniacum]